LGDVFIWVSGVGPYKTSYKYPDFNKFSDEGGSAIKGNLIQYIENTVSSHQYEHFVTPVSYGLTNAGQARINQSIEAFVYCILGSQVNVRSSIIGSSGSAKEVRREFLVLIEDAIQQPDISKSVQRFQLVIQEAKVKLDLAISPGTWLMPSRMIINTESTVGYNNKLKKANLSMKLGVNSDVNIEQKPVGIKHNLGVSKVQLPHTVKTNRQTAITEVKPSGPVKKSEVKLTGQARTTQKDNDGFNSKHEVNLALIIIGVGDLAWFPFR